MCVCASLIYTWIFLSPELKALILAKTASNPFFIVVWMKNILSHFTISPLSAGNKDHQISYGENAVGWDFAFSFFFKPNTATRLKLKHVFNDLSAKFCGAHTLYKTWHGLRYNERYKKN